MTDLLSLDKLQPATRGGTYSDCVQLIQTLQSFFSKCPYSAGTLCHSFILPLLQLLAAVRGRAARTLRAPRGAVRGLFYTPIHLKVSVCASSAVLFSCNLIRVWIMTTARLFLFWKEKQIACAWRACTSTIRPSTTTVDDFFFPCVRFLPFRDGRCSGGVSLPCVRDTLTHWAVKRPQGFDWMLLHSVTPPIRPATPWPWCWCVERVDRTSCSTLARLFARKNTFLFCPFAWCFLFFFCCFSFFFLPRARWRWRHLSLPLIGELLWWQCHGRKGEERKDSFTTWWWWGGIKKLTELHCMKCQIFKLFF